MAPTAPRPRRSRPPGPGSTCTEPTRSRTDKGWHQDRGPGATPSAHRPALGDPGTSVAGHDAKPRPGERPGTSGSAGPGATWRAWAGRTGPLRARRAVPDRRPRPFRLDQSVVGPGVPLTDAQWARIEPLLPDRSPKQGGGRRHHCEVIDAIACKFQTGTRCVHLPEKYGNCAVRSPRSARPRYHRGRRGRPRPDVLPGALDSPPPRREFRTAPAGVHDVHANLSIGNMDYAEFADAASDGPDRIYRSI
ncbi:transposase [Streptomyces sp. NPDC048111]|uniref:transposase n=1 Tax=Streptomyces sp. NPDC048111 TaxID=3365500 RepID=UPI0037214EEF